MIGLSLGTVPKFARHYMNLAEEIIRILKEFRQEVYEGKFPAEEHYFRMEDEEFKKLTSTVNMVK
jgi:3-methyl-2-oxobutanoate hydroxymethyltransferase